MNDYDRAIVAFESVLKYNPYSTKALTYIASIYRSKMMYTQAAKHFQQLLQIERSNGDVWGALGHCFLMSEDLQNAYQAYQQALNCLNNPRVLKQHDLAYTI